MEANIKENIWNSFIGVILQHIYLSEQRGYIISNILSLI